MKIGMTRLIRERVEMGCMCELWLALPLFPLISPRTRRSAGRSILAQNVYLGLPCQQL